jgi:hypothetical protein
VDGKCAGDASEQTRGGGDAFALRRTALIAMLSSPVLTSLCSIMTFRLESGSIPSELGAYIRERIAMWWMWTSLQYTG